MHNNFYRQAKFLISAAEIKQLPDAEGREVAFCGRSNAGKSTLLNVLTSQNRLAKTSKTPGRTQLINFFELDEYRRLVDLPGFGYAKVSMATKKRWQRVIYTYLEERESLAGAVLLMDIRHPLKPDDVMLIEWAAKSKLPLYLVLTKADKLSNQQRLKSVAQVRKYLELNNLESFKVQVFSALKKGESNKDLLQLEGLLNQWLEV